MSSDGNNEIDFAEFVAVMSRKVIANYSSDQVGHLIHSDFLAANDSTGDGLIFSQIIYSIDHSFTG